MLGPKRVRLVEQNIENDRLRLLLRDMIDQFTVNRARPWPVAGIIIHVLKRFLVDIDDHNSVRLRSAIGIEREQ